MTAVKVDLLRIVLAPSHAGISVSVPCGWRLPGGAWHSGQFENLVEIAIRFRAKRVEVCPHPVDVSMIEADLPPLPARKLRSAAHGAVELLALGSPVSLAIGFGPRNGDGKVPIAWTADGQVAGHLEALAQHGLGVDAVLAPPAFLPMPDSSGQDDVVSAAIIDDWVVVRSGENSGGLFPFPARSRDAAKLEARVQALVPEAARIQWHRAEMAAGTGGDEPPMWSGAGWRWELPLAERSAQAREASWRRPAMAWGAGVVLVWLLGLNIYAHRVQEEGQALKRAMAAQVKAAFPELSVVLNPLQQARQLRDARNAGDGSAASDDFAAMVRSATSLLAQANGQVERLEYQSGQLRVGWREGAMLKASELEALQTTASERGLAIDADDGGLRLRVVAVEERDPAPVAPAEPSS